MLDILADSQLSVLNKDLQILITHYTGMLRRHIVGDSEIAKLSRQIYRKHQRAIDLIYEHRPDIQAEIKDIVRGLLTQNPQLEYDSRAFGNDIVRFAVRAWDTTALLTSNIKSSRYGRILLFEFWNHPDRLQLKLIVWPGPDETRQKLLDIARNNRHVFDTPHNYVASYYEIFSRLLLESDMYGDATDTEREAEIRKNWASFLEEDLPRIDAALKQESWIWQEPGESE